MKKAFIKTYGCQMNEQDSGQMHGLLGSLGFAKTLDQFDADLILINTCSIREKAVHKVYSELGRIRPLKDDNPDLVVGVAGCVAEQEKEKISKRFPFLDLVFGPDHIRHLPKMIEEIEINREEQKKVEELKTKTITHTGFDLRKDFEFVNVLPKSEECAVKAFVNIQKGCDNICSFCIVPFVRGREVSRPYEEIIDEVNQLVAMGVKEVTLLGQNVNSYGLKTTGGVSFAKLLELIAAKTDLKRLRFTTSHPKDVEDDLIDQYANNPILAPQFHLPVQSGNNRILDLMRRQYTVEHYMSIVERLKKRVPQISLSSDIIVGFPTETDQEFEDTLSLMKQVEYDQVYSFVYSPRPYTSAIKLTDDVPRRVKQERLKKLQGIDKDILIKKSQVDVGRICEVLVESIDEGEYPVKGRTAENKIVHFKAGDYKPGDLINDSGQRGFL